GPSGGMTAYLGRAHPLVLQAIRHGCGLDGAVTVARGDHVGLLLTFEVAIPVSGRMGFRQIVAVMASPDRQPIEVTEWPVQCATEFLAPTDALWYRLFAYWARSAQSRSERLVSLIAARMHAAFVARHLALKQQEMLRARRWLCAKSDLL